MANRFWVGGTATWDGTPGSKWALTSGGAGGVTQPSATDDVFFDGASGSGTVSINGSGGVTCKSLDFNGFTGTLGTGSTIAVGTTGSGNVVCRFSTGMAITWTGNLVLGSNGTTSLTTNGKSLGSQVNSASTTGTISLQDALLTTAAGGINILNGTFTTNGFAVTTPVFITNGTGTRTINLGASTLNLTGTGTVWNSGGASGLTFNAGTSTINITDTSSTNKTFNSNSKTFNNISITGGGSGRVNFQDTNTINVFTIGAPKTVRFTAGATQTVTSFVATGTPGNVITFDTDTAGTFASISRSSGVVSCDYLSLKDNHAVGGATFYAGANSTNVSGNSGWLFTAPPKFTISAAASLAAVGASTKSVPFTMSPHAALTAVGASQKSSAFTMSPHAALSAVGRSTSPNITRVQSAAISFAIGATSKIISFGASPTNGNALMLTAGGNGDAGSAGGAITSITQTGATWVKAIGNLYDSGVRTANAEIWYALNVSGAGTAITVNMASGGEGGAIVIAEYTNIAIASAVDKTAVNQGLLGTTDDSGTTATTAQNDELWIGSLGRPAFAGDSYTSPSNGFVIVGQSCDENYGMNGMFEKIVSSTGAANVSATSTINLEWSGAIATFKKAVSASVSTFTAHAALANIGQSTALGVAALSPHAALSGVGQSIARGVLTISAGASLVAVGQSTARGVLAIAADTDFTAQSLSGQGTYTITASATFAAIGRAIKNTAFAMTPNALITAVGMSTARGVATSSPHATFPAVGKANANSAFLIVVAATVTFVGRSTARADYIMATDSDLDARGAERFNSALTVAAAATVAFQGATNTHVIANFAPSAALAAVGMSTARTAASFSPHAGFSAVGAAAARASTVITADSDMTAVGRSINLRNVYFLASTTLDAQGRSTARAVLNITADTDFSVYGVTYRIGTATFTARAVFVARAVRITKPPADRTFYPQGMNREMSAPDVGGVLYGTTNRFIV